MYDARGTRAQGTALRVANEVVASRGEVEGNVRKACRPELAREQAMQQVHGKVSRFKANVFLLVFKDHVVNAGAPGATRLSERHFHTGNVLKLDRHVLQHVAEPGALVFRHAADETARLAIGAAVLVQPWKHLE